MTVLVTRAISLRQPWAHAVINGGKRVENRRWPTKFRGRILLHAAKGMTTEEFQDFIDFCRAAELDGEWRRVRPEDLPRGGIVGIATIVDCVTQCDSRWFFGPNGFILEDVRPTPFVPCRGMLGIFNVPEEVAQAALAA